MTPVEIWNLALLKIGHSKGIEALDDATREAYTGAAVYDHQLRQVLRRFPWSFATKYVGCLATEPYPFYLVSGPFWSTDPTELTLVQAWSASATYVVGDVVRNDDVNYYCIMAHTNHEPPDSDYWSTSEDDAPEGSAGGDWLYAYRWPTDCLFVRRVVPPGSVGSGRLFNADPPPHRIGRDVNGLLIYTNVPEAVIEYTMIDCDHLWADDLFIDALTWKLAAYAAPSLSQIKDMAITAMRMYERCFDDAAIVSSREQQQEKPGEAEWISGR